LAASSSSSSRPSQPKGEARKPTRRRNIQNEGKTWYDYPQYYDLGFADESEREANFLHLVFKQLVPGKTRKIFEPGCGTGRIVLEMARRGNRVEKQGVGKLVTLVQGDMTNFRFPHRFDAAFNTLNTFRHLTTEDEAVKHLRVVAEHLKTGGVYVLGFHLLPPDADLYGTERWSAKKGTTKINYALTVRESSRQTRVELLRITMSIHRPQGVLKLYDEFPLRTYSAAQVRSLLKRVPELELKGVYDFWYDLDEPQKLNNDLSDAVFVLQKK
jgi:SAM-dependent methyltransferase